MAQAQFNPSAPYAPLTTEESEHERQLAPSRVKPSGLAQFLAPADETANPQAYDPNTLRGYGARVGQALKSAVSSVVGMVDSPLPGMEGNPIIWNPVTQVKKDVQQFKDWNDLRKKNPDYAWAGILAPMLLTHVIGSLAPKLLPVGMGDKLAAGAGVDPADVEPVAADLRAARALPHPDTGKPIGTPNTVQDFADLAYKAEESLNNEYSQALGANAMMKGNLPDVDGNFPLSQAILKLKDKYSPETEWGRNARSLIDKRAAEYQKPISLGNLDLERKNANSRIDNFEASSQIKQASRRIASPDIAVDETIANWVRDTVYPDMDKLTGKPPGYFRQLKSRIGNLMRLQSETEIQAEKVRKSAATSRGTHLLDKLRPGISVGAEGRPHGWLGNVKEAVAPIDRETSADEAVHDAFQWRRRFAPSKGTRRLIKAGNMPLSVLVGGSSAGESAHQRIGDLLKPVPMQ